MVELWKGVMARRWNGRFSVVEQVRGLRERQECFVNRRNLRAKMGRLAALGGFSIAVSVKRAHETKSKTRKA